MCVFYYGIASKSLSGPENMHTLVTVLRCILCFQRITFFKNMFHSSRRVLLTLLNVTYVIFVDFNLKKSLFSVLILSFDKLLRRILDQNTRKQLAGKFKTANYLLLLQKL